MFDDVLLDSSRSRVSLLQRAAIPIAYAVQILLVGILVLVPLLHVEALPRWISRDLVPPPSAPPPAAASAAVRQSARHTTWAEALQEPVKIPTTIVMLQEEPLPPEEAPGFGNGVQGGVPGGVDGGVPNGPLGAVPWGTPPPPPPQPASRPPRTRAIRVSSGVIAAKLIFHPSPEYPPLAKMARVQGTVLLEAVIGRDGTIQELKVQEGHPLLVRAALEAVRQWRYQPTLLNGEPVDVLTEIEVNFKLAD